MKKILIGALALLSLTAMTSCDAHTSGNIDIDPTDVTYFKDSRSGLCFGAVASRKSGEASSSGLGLTCVPCESVKDLLDD